MARSTTTTARSTTRGTAAGKPARATRTASKASADYTAALNEEWEEVADGTFARTWKFEDDGVLIGTYLGTEERVIDRFVDKKKGDDGTRVFHLFRLDDGEEVEAWGAAILNSRLSNVAEGTRVRVEDTGKKLSLKGGRSAREFKVLVPRGAVR